MEKFEVILNYVVEEVIKEVFFIFRNVIMNMMIVDGFIIFNGGDGVVMCYLKEYIIM